MRNELKNIARMLLIVSVTVCLTTPATARARDEDPRSWLRPEFVRIIKQIVIRGFGDGLTVPRP